MQSIQWSGNPRLYLRTSPAWYALYRVISAEKLSRKELSKLVGVDEEFIRQRQVIPGMLQRDKNQFNLIDAIILSVVIDYRDDPKKFEFLEHMLYDYEDAIWQSLIAIVQGAQTFISVDFDKTLTRPYFSSGPGDLDHDAGETPILMNPHFVRMLAQPAWPEFSVEFGEDQRWFFKFKDRGYLQLEALPLNDEKIPRRPWDAMNKTAGERDEKGCKLLTTENYMKVDPFFESVTWWAREPEKREERLKERIDEILSIQLQAAVPIEVRELFDVLKGSMIYGHFYRPIFTNISDQVYFVAEAAVYHRCKALGIEPSKKYERNLGILKKRGIIPKDEWVMWDAKQDLRNRVAHKRHRSLNWPGNDIQILELMADDISRLFMPLFGEKRPVMRSGQS